MSKLRRGKILIVEDDIGLAEALPVFLERFLFQVRVVSSVDAAKKELVLDHFDVMVLDWILPDGGGRDVMNFAREVVPEIGIIVFSAHESSDSECTPVADEFVEKGQDVLALKNAIDRCMRLAKDREGWIRSPSECGNGSNVESIAESITNGIDINEYVKGPFAVASEDEWLSSSVAKYMCRLFKRPEMPIKEIDLKSHSERTPYSRLFGECRTQSGRSPSLVRGILDDPMPSCVVVRNAQFLSQDDSEALARSAATRSIRRIGSERDIFSDFQLIVTVGGNGGSDPIARIGDRLRRIIGDRVVRIPSPRDIPGGMKAVAISSHSSSCKEPRSLNPGIEKLLEAGLWGESWGMMPQFSSSDHGSENVIEPEMLGFSMFESAIVTRKDGKSVISKWKDVEIIPRAIYVCRVLSETKGNIAEAARISGMRRNAIYEILSHFKIDIDRFRPRPLFGQLDSTVRTSRSETKSS